MSRQLNIPKDPYQGKMIVKNPMIGDSEVGEAIKKCLNVVEKAYKDFSAFDFVRITHGVGTPWEKTYKKRQRNEIVKEQIKVYYGK